MKQNVTVRLPEKITSELTKIAQNEGLSKSQIVRNALEDYIFIKKFRELRNKMVARAQAQGVFTDEDIFEKIS